MQILSNILMPIEFLSFFYIVFCRTFRRISGKRLYALIAVTTAWIGAIIAGFDWGTRAVGPIPAFFFLFIILVEIIFELPFGEAFLMAIANWLVISIIELSIETVTKILMLDSGLSSFLIMLFITGSAWIFYLASKKKYDELIFRLPIRIWILIDLMILILTTMLAFIAYIVVYNRTYSDITVLGEILVVIGSASITLMLFYFVYFAGSSYRYQMQKNVAEMQVVQQKEYFQHLLKREEETKKFRHDIINDLIEIRNYCDKHECEKMRKYLENITGVINTISKNTYDVGNDVVNTVLNYYLMPIRDKHEISVEGYMSEKSSIDDRDLCIIFANLIKNACEAMDKSANGRLWIRINEGRDNLCIQVKNTFEGDITLDKKGIPVSTKNNHENHGYGVKNTIDAVKRNAGSYSIDISGGLFQIEIFLKK